jgi:hypothetical protein
MIHAQKQLITSQLTIVTVCAVMTVICNKPSPFHSPPPPPPPPHPHFQPHPTPYLQPSAPLNHVINSRALLQQSLLVLLADVQVDGPVSDIETDEYERKQFSGTLINDDGSSTDDRIPRVMLLQPLWHPHTVTRVSESQSDSTTPACCLDVTLRLYTVDMLQSDLLQHQH